MTRNAFLAALSGGDLPATAHREGRCLNAPIGCGLPVSWPAVADEHGPEQAITYRTEWRISGLCPDCQNLIDEEGDR